MIQDLQLVKDQTQQGQGIYNAPLISINTVENEKDQPEEYIIFPTIVIHQVQDEESVEDHQEKTGQLQEEVFSIKCLQKTDKKIDINDETSRQENKDAFDVHIQNHLFTENITEQKDLNLNSRQGGFQFQVVVHEVRSRQSIASNNQQQYANIFTKSQINIPLELDIYEKQKLQTVSIEPTQPDIYKKSQEQSDEYDFYVHFLQQKWAQRDQEKSKSSVDCQKLNKPFQKQESTKKTQFKVKKINDRSNCSTTNVRSVQKSNDHVNLKLIKNSSQVIKSNNQVKKQPYKYHREGKKHMSNFQSVNRSLERTPVKKQDPNNVQYQIFMSQSVQMMSHILQDRCYNNLNSKNNCQKGQIKEEPVNKIRKIIKRSPYGILEIQVRDKKNTAKITNLRILRPKQMTRLKKIPKVVKTNKQNILFPNPSYKQKPVLTELGHQKNYLAGILPAIFGQKR